MKSVTRVLPAVIAMATLLFLANCSKKDSQQSSFNSSITESLAKKSGASSDQAASSTGSYFRMMPNAKSDVVVPALCGSISKDFISGGTTYGTITVGNNTTDYYFTISGVNGWMLKKVRLYSGTESGIPLNGGGLPLFNDYPMNESFSAPYPTTWSFSVPIEDLGASFWVSVRMDFINATGDEVGVWSAGEAFKSGNPSSKFYCEQQECVVVTDEGCAFGQGYWFGNGNQSWPDVNGATAGDVTIGAENYTREEARAIWWANNGNCPGIPDAKKAFAFVAAIKLSGASVIGNPGLWDDVNTANSWLESLDRLSETNICGQPAAPAPVKEAVARIGSWFDAHKCD